MGIINDVGRIYLSRKGRRGLTSVEDTVKLAVLGPQWYVLISEEGMIIAARGVDGDYEKHLGMIESVKQFKESRRNEWCNLLKQKKFMDSYLTKLKKLQGKKNNYG